MTEHFPQKYLQLFIRDGTTIESGKKEIEKRDCVFAKEVVNKMFQKHTFMCLLLRIIIGSKSFEKITFFSVIMRHLCIFCYYTKTLGK